jgi:hypothetical protein
MAYVLAVWEGARPATDFEALAIYDRLSQELDNHPQVAAGPAITAYVHDLLARWPDILDEEGADSPWSDGPLIDNASGPLVVFGMVWSQAAEASTYCVEVAERHGLVCLDPEEGRLRTRPSQVQAHEGGASGDPPKHADSRSLRSLFKRRH